MQEAGLLTGKAWFDWAQAKPRVLSQRLMHDDARQILASTMAQIGRK